MARYRRQRSNPMGLLDNPIPRIFGTDLRESIEGVGGIVATAILNDKVFSGLTQKWVMGFKNANHTVGQLIDAGTTLFAAHLVGIAGRKLFGAAIGQRMAEGGGLYGGAKVVTAFVPKVSVSALYPDYFEKLALFGGTPAPTPSAGALASGSGGSPDVFTNNPRPVAAGSDVGW